MYDGIILSVPAAARGDLIDASVRERPASQDPPRRHDAATERAVKADRLLRVMRAGGVELALSAERARQHEPVGADEREEDTPEGSTCPPCSGSQGSHGCSARAR
jgi:hypothetical protein